MSSEPTLHSPLITHPENSGIAICVQNLSKCYQIYDKPHDRLKQSLYPRMLRLIGKPARQYHREFWALKDVSFEIKKGETVGIIGRNGSGKSTLLQLICGTLMPTGGSVETNGRIAALLELGSGFNPEFTGRENVRMSCALLGLSPAETEARFDDIAAFADIGDFIEQPVKTYSSGMYVRLAFSVMSAIDPEILIVDEALAVGDLRFTLKCTRRIRELIEKGTSCLFVSHDMASIVNLCDRAIWINNGEVTQIGSSREVMLNYQNYMVYGLCFEEGQSLSAKLVDENGDRSEVASRRQPDIKAIEWVDVSHLPSSGVRGAIIQKIAVYSVDRSCECSIVYGGERLQIHFLITAVERLKSPNVCAHFLDRHGNLVFGVNTHFIAGSMEEWLPGAEMLLTFNFEIPLIMNGDYAVAIAVCDGSLSAHVQHHVILEAATLKVFTLMPSADYYGVSLESASYSVTASS